ncbi:MULTISPECIES: galactonate dehydratase [unclassified Sinorhizobium]|uniref:galactonate dehydratase n=1 Tax=unclassified Sinorhizobium TaxID=2613772 RepID=UPI0024C46C9C|nr:MULTISPECIES: galactonate dehydratase [unclassified Sinorhizobium]MDK1377300.1 galactonate dehydratase [Sinorhizobium sp. 6-70]MDK1481575.1 galactonate dehydratase [Sinorhizobium sp. 6-117]
MSRIASIETFRVPPRWIFVRVTTDDGLTGWGESIIPKRARAVVAAIEDMAANLKGVDVSRIEDIAQRLRRGAFFRHGPILATAAAGIEQALWDIKGQRADMPVYEFLGGAVRNHVRAYAWIGGDSPNDIVEHARKRMEEGFTAVKMNATPALGHIGQRNVIDAAAARMGALRDAFGNKLDIALDLHGRVHRAALKPLLAELEQFHPMWVEEATTPENEETLKMLASAARSIPVATGERLNSRWEFKRVLDTGAIDIIQPDVSITGLFELEKIARMAEVYDVAVAPHCPNGPISLAASLQVGFCCPNIVIQEQSLGLHYHAGFAGLPKADLLDYLKDTKPLTTADGVFALNDAPGLGIVLDEEGIVAKQQDWRLPDADWTHPDGTYAEW